MFTFKITEDIYLKMLNDNDSRNLFKLIDINRNHLRSWLPWVDGIRDMLDVKSFIKKSKEQYASNNGFQAGVWYKERLVGVIGFHKIDWINKKTTIGYWIGKEYQGKGIISKACKALINHAFYSLELNKVEIHCGEGNDKSSAIPKRFNFKKEGTIREAEWLYDHYINHIVFGCLKGEWEESLH